MCSLLHKGQRPGVLRRVRFLNEKPHCWQEAGSIVKPLWCADFSICIRWSRTSLSLIPNNFEISRKSRASSSKASAIFFLRVDILSFFKLTSESYQTLHIDWPNDSLTWWLTALMLWPTSLWMTPTTPINLFFESCGKFLGRSVLEDLWQRAQSAQVLWSYRWSWKNWFENFSIPTVLPSVLYPNRVQIKWFSKRL